MANPNSPEIIGPVFNWRDYFVTNPPQTGITYTISEVDLLQNISDADSDTLAVTGSDQGITDGIAIGFYNGNDILAKAISGAIGSRIYEFTLGPTKVDSTFKLRAAYYVTDLLSNIPSEAAYTTIVSGPGSTIDLL